MEETVTWLCDDCDEKGLPAIFTGPKDKTDRKVEAHMGELGHFVRRIPNPTDDDPFPQEEIVTDQTPPPVRIEKNKYPRQEGDHWVLGPGIFSDSEKPHLDVVVNWAGYNLVDQDRLISAEAELEAAQKPKRTSRAAYVVAYILVAAVVSVLIPPIAALWRWGFGL